MEDYMTRKGLSTNKDDILHKSYKVSSIVLINRNDSIKRMTQMLSAPNKFKKLDIKPRKEINSLLQQEDRLNNFLEKVKRVSVISYIKSFIQEAHNLVFCIICLKSINH